MHYSKLNEEISTRLINDVKRYNDNKWGNHIIKKLIRRVYLISISTTDITNICKLP